MTTKERKITKGACGKHLLVRVGAPLLLGGAADFNATNGGYNLSPSTDYEAKQQSNTITVKGVVVDAQDEPIIGATVQVRGVSGKVTALPT